MTRDKDCLGIQAGGKNIYGVLRGPLPARLIARVKIPSDHMQPHTVLRLGGVQFLIVVNFRCRSDVHSVVTVQPRNFNQELTIVDIRTILGLAHLRLETDRCWLLKRRIYLRTFNAIYYDHEGGLYNNIYLGSDVAQMTSRSLPYSDISSRLRLHDKGV